jgi:UTP--glucose-1-phosphate uridylyltransferase
MPDHVAATLTKMRESGAHPAEVAALRRRLDQLNELDAGQLPGNTLEPLAGVRKLDDLPAPSPAEARSVLDQLVVIKLNGGLGTSMGLSGPKSSLEVKPGTSFLDIIAQQVLALRDRYQTRLPLMLMNSSSTQGPSLEVLERYADLGKQDVPMDFLQGREPKIRADDLQPVEWPANPALEWCPSGHGDIYTSLAASGTTERLLGAGVRWCFVSNADNLGSRVDVRIASWIASENIPFAMEVVRGTPADRKGGHLARHKGRIILRESAQVPDGDPSFADVDYWKFFNTNNLWIDLRALNRLQDENPAAPELPLIVNRKTVDPTAPDSTPVLQLETAMGAAIGSIEGAQAVEVPRTRFVPVKTTDDLLVIRSDAYSVSDNGEVTPRFAGAPPVVSLSREYFRLLRDFDGHFPAGPPSLVRCTSLTVDGDVVFGAAVSIEGAVTVTGPRVLADGTELRG